MRWWNWQVKCRFIVWSRQFDGKQTVLVIFLRCSFEGDWWHNRCWHNQQLRGGRCWRYSWDIGSWKYCSRDRWYLQRRWNERLCCRRRGWGRDGFCGRSFSNCRSKYTTCSTPKLIVILQKLFYCMCLPSLKGICVYRLAWKIIAFNTSQQHTASWPSICSYVSICGEGGR